MKKPPPHSTLRGFGSNDCGFHSVGEHSSGPLGEGLQGWRLEERVGVKCRASGEMDTVDMQALLHVNLSRIQDGDGGGKRLVPISVSEGEGSSPFFARRRFNVLDGSIEQAQTNLQLEKSQ